MYTRTDAYIQAMLDLIYLNIPFAGIGDVTGIQASSAAGNLYVALLTDSGETAYTGYARVAVPRSSIGWNRVSNVMSNTADVEFTLIPSGTTQQVGTKVAIYTDASAGIKLHEVTLGTSITIQAGIRPIVEAAAITITGS